MSFSHDDIQARIVRALQALKENHASLLQAANMSEAGLTHYFTNELAKQFKGWDVDYDYSLETIWPENSANSKKIYPDVIVHRRGDPRQRILALEIKKWGCPPKMIKRDREKLTEYLQQMDYQHAAFVFLPCTEGFDKPESQMLFFHPPLKNKTQKPVEKASEPVTVTSAKVVAKPTPKVHDEAPQAISTEPTTPKQTPHINTAPIVETPTNEHDGEPQDQTSQNGVINEHLLTNPDTSPLIYPDQLNLEAAPRVPLPYAHNSFDTAANHDQKPRAILKPLGLDIHNQEHTPVVAIEEQAQIESTKVEALQPKPNPNDPYQSAPLHDFKDALQKMPKSLFPSRIYIEPSFWDEIPEPEDKMPQPQSKSENSSEPASKSYQQN